MCKINDVFQGRYTKNYCVVTTIDNDNIYLKYICSLDFYIFPVYEAMVDHLYLKEFFLECNKSLTHKIKLISGENNV